MTRDFDSGGPNEAADRQRNDLAELRGALCGLLCAHAVSAQDPLAALSPILPVQGSEDHEIAEFVDSLSAVTGMLMAQLREGHFDIERLLPVEDLPIRKRASAFVSWCGGFLSGIGLAGDRRLAGLSGEASEVLTDLSEFTKMSLLIQPSEQAETDLMELIEYVRVGAMLLYEELAPSRAHSSGTVH